MHRYNRHTAVCMFAQIKHSLVSLLYFDVYINVIQTLLNVTLAKGDVSKTAPTPLVPTIAPAMLGFNWKMTFMAVRVRERINSNNAAHVCHTLFTGRH